MNKTKKTWIAAIALGAIIAVLGMVWSTQRGSDKQASVPQETQESQSPAAPGGSEKTEVTTDYFGNRVIIPPADHSGGMALSDSVVTTEDRCSDIEKVRAPQGLQMQRVNEVNLAFSTSDGPVKTVPEHVPDGYSRTPAGAALSAANMVAMTFSGGPMYAESLLLFSGMSPDEKREFEAQNPNWRTSYPSKKIDMSGAATLPSAHRVVSCYDDVVVVALAYQEAGDENGLYDAPRWISTKIPLKWIDGRWQGDSSSAVQPIRTEIGPELGSGWQRWQF